MMYVHRRELRWKQLIFEHVFCVQQRMRDRVEMVGTKGFTPSSHQAFIIDRNYSGSLGERK